MRSINLFGPCHKGTYQDKLDKLHRTTKGATSFGYDYFDNPHEDFSYSYGGYYDNSFFSPAITPIIDTYSLNKSSSILDVGCAKGYLLNEFSKRGYTYLAGIDVSKYALNLAPDSIQHNLLLHDIGKKLPYEDNLFDLVICKDSITYFADPAYAIGEMIRVSRGNVFIQIDSVSPLLKELVSKADPLMLTIEPQKWWLSFLESLDYLNDYYIKQLLESE